MLICEFCRKQTIVVSPHQILDKNTIRCVECLVYSDKKYIEEVFPRLLSFEFAEDFLEERGMLGEFKAYEEEKLTRTCGDCARTYETVELKQKCDCLIDEDEDLPF